MLRPDVVAQITATLALCGLIWTVQVVHYPLLARVGADAFRGYHAALVRTNWVRTAAWTARGALCVWLLSRGVA